MEFRGRGGILHNKCFYRATYQDEKLAAIGKETILPLANKISAQRAHARDKPKTFDDSIMADENVCMAFAKLVGPLHVVSCHADVDEFPPCLATYTSPIQADATWVLFEPSARHYSALVLRESNSGKFFLA